MTLFTEDTQNCGSQLQVYVNDTWFLKPMLSSSFHPSNSGLNKVFNLFFHKHVAEKLSRTTAAVLVFPP